MAQRSPRLTPTVREHVRRYRQILRRAGLPVQQILVFGSQAKGTAQTTSDVDVAVISKCFGKNYVLDRRKLLHLLPSDLWAIEPHPLHPDDLEDRWSTFAHEVKKYGIAVK